MTVDHALYVSRRMRDVDFKEVMATRWEEGTDRFALDVVNLPGIAFTAIGPHGLPVAIGGVAFHTPKVGTAWLVGTDEFTKSALSITRHVRRVIKDLLATELNRIHAWSACFHTDAHRWMEHCGMNRGNPIKAMGKNGEDFYLYSVVKGS